VVRRGRAQLRRQPRAFVGAELIGMQAQSQTLLTRRSQYAPRLVHGKCKLLAKHIAVFRQPRSHNPRQHFVNHYV
jgi:hypothetical protein